MTSQLPWWNNSFFEVSTLKFEFLAIRSCWHANNEKSQWSRFCDFQLNKKILAAAVFFTEENGQPGDQNNSPNNESTLAELKFTRSSCKLQQNRNQLSLCTMTVKFKLLSASRVGQTDWKSNQPNALRNSILKRSICHGCAIPSPNANGSKWESEKSILARQESQAERL